MGKQTARPAPEKETAKQEAGKQEGALKDDELKDVAGGGGSVAAEVNSYIEYQRQSGHRIIRIPGN